MGFKFFVMKLLFPALPILCWPVFSYIEMIHSIPDLKSFKSVLLKWRWFRPPLPQPRDIGQRVETFLVARTPGKNATGIWWGRGGCETSHSTQRRAPSAKNYLDQMSVSPRLRTPNLNRTKISIILPKVYILYTFIFQTILILFKVIHVHRGGERLLLFHCKLSSTSYPQFYFTEQPLSNLRTASVPGRAA